MKGCRLRWQRKNLIQCPEFVDHYTLPWIDANHPAPAELENEIIQGVQQRREELEKQRRFWLAEDARINAWLRGDCGHPPLLALMQGAA